MDCVLKDLIAVSKDGEWGKGEPFDDSVEMLAIRGTDFEDVRFGFTGGTPRRHIAKRHAERKLLQPWDVIIEAAGGTKNQITGRTVLLRPQLFSRSELPFTCASFSRFIRFNTELCDPAFMFWYLQRLYASGSMHAYHTQHTGVARFQWTTFSEREPLSLPPLAVQRRIAGILSAYDELMENSQRRIRLLEAMARALYREWFVHFRFPGHEKHPRVASPLGDIPQGWEVKKLGDIAEDMRRNVPKGQLEEPKPYVGLEHIPRRSLALDAWETATELGSNKLEFKKGEVLFGKIRPYFHKVSVAPFDGLCSADTIVVRARRPEHYAVVVACVSSDAFVAEASATANGAKMPRANWDVLEKFPVVIPKGKVAEKFSALFADIIAQQQALIFQIQNLRRTRDLLLPRLLSGQAALPHPASPSGRGA